MSRFATTRVTPLLAALVLAGCGLDFSTPRAYRCSTDEECRGGWRCLGDAYCHDPAVGVATPCGADGDCAGGWRCLGDKVCHDPAVGVTTPCQATADCAGAWRCLGDRVCHDPEVGVATPCQATADCAGTWRCADGQCRDPDVGVTVTCLTSADCLGGWYCGREKVCRDPGNPGPFPCTNDAECAGGWRCNTEGVCTDAAAELSLVAPPGPVPPALQLSPSTGAPLGMRVVSPLVTFDGARGTATETQVVSLRLANAVVARVLWSAVGSGTSSADHLVATRRWPVNGAQVSDFLASANEALVLFVDGGVSRGLPDGGLLPVPLGVPARKLVSTTHDDGPDPVTDLVVLTALAAGGGAVLVADGGTFGAQVLDVVPVQLEDGGAGQAWASLEQGPGGPEERLYVVDDFAVGAKGTGWARAVQAGDALLSELRARGQTLAGAWRAKAPVGTGPQSAASDYAQVLDYPVMNPPPFVPPPLARVVCQPGDRLVDFELVKDASGTVVLEGACLSPGAESALVYVATTETDQRLVLERRGVQHAGANGGHARVNRWGVPRLGSTLRDYELSPSPSMRPTTVGLVARAPVAVSEAQLYLLPGDGSLELQLQRSDGDPLDRLVGVVEAASSVILGSGAAFDFSQATDAGPRLDFVLEGTPRLARATARRLSGALVASGDDTLYAAQRPDAGLTLLRSVLRPAPGFPIDAWAARATDGGYEGWLVANNQLFRLEANSVARWRSTPWPVQGRDVLGTWWAGDGARVGTATGEVLSLPSRVPVVPPVPGGVTSITGWCGDVLATADDEILSWRGDAGWVVVDAGVPGPLRAPRLVPAGEGVFVTDEDGVLVLFGLGSGCP